MPTYEYRCPNGHNFERFFRSISGAQREVACPDCGVVGERLLSVGAGFLFKGSGFYITDYGKDGKKDQRPAAKADDGAAAASGDGAAPATSNGAGGEAKPAADAKPASDPKSAADSKPAGEPKPALGSKSAADSKPVVPTKKPGPTE